MNQKSTFCKFLKKKKRTNRHWRGHVYSEADINTDANISWQTHRIWLHVKCGNLQRVLVGSTILIFILDLAKWLIGILEIRFVLIAYLLYIELACDKCDANRNEYNDDRLREILVHFISGQKTERGQIYSKTLLLFVCSCTISH